MVVLELKINMAEETAYHALITSGVNELIRDNEEYLKYKGGNEGNYSSKALEFDINGERCVVSSMPIGFGEDRITVVYRCNDIKVVKKVNQTLNPGDLKNNIKLTTGKTHTAVKVDLERKDGPYIQTLKDDCNEHNYNDDTFTFKKCDINQLKNINPSPNGFHLFGAFKF